MDIYNLSGNVDIWWQDLKRVKGIKEKNVNWSTFKRYFKNKFMSEQYYEERAKEFYELNSKFRINDYERSKQQVFKST